jgi:hypothetical protein
MLVFMLITNTKVLNATEQIFATVPNVDFIKKMFNNENICNLS